MIFFLVLLSLASSACSESNNQGDVQEQPSTPVQESPVSPQASSVPQEGENGPRADMESDSIRLEAQEQLTQANEAVEKSQQLLKRAPSGKGSALAIAALRQDLNAAQTLLQTSQTHFNDEQFTMARDKAQEAKEKANTVGQQIEQAIETVKLNSP